MATKEVSIWVRRSVGTQPSVQPGNVCKTHNFLTHYCNYIRCKRLHISFKELEALQCIAEGIIVFSLTVAKKCKNRDSTCREEVTVERSSRALIKWGWGSRGGGQGGPEAGRLIPPRAATPATRVARGAMVARTDEMFGCYGDSYSYRLWSLANVWGCRCE
ncbi:unnamed protein product [Colias eurytheme]|nr:unnamed protein product [Colias eurytheme]